MKRELFPRRSEVRFSGVGSAQPAATRVRHAIVGVITGILLGIVALPAQAHCDSMDGPVVKDAVAALEQREVTPVLKWVEASQEDAVRTAFSRALAVRVKGAEARALADQFFFETLVRLHRAGEGEAFTGLKPAGSIEPGLAEADEALRSGTAEALSNDLADEVRAGVRGRHGFVVQRAEHANRSVEEGRAYVRAYVDYAHYIESLHRLVMHGAPHSHAAEAAHK
jgi:hypothetical protein